MDEISLIMRNDVAYRLGSSHSAAVRWPTFLEDLEQAPGEEQSDGYLSTPVMEMKEMVKAYKAPYP